MSEHQNLKDLIAELKNTNVSLFAAYEDDIDTIKPINFSKDKYEPVYLDNSVYLDGPDDDKKTPNYLVLVFISLLIFSAIGITIYFASSK